MGKQRGESDDVGHSTVSASVTPESSSASVKPESSSEMDAKKRGNQEGPRFRDLGSIIEDLKNRVLFLPSQPKLMMSIGISLVRSILIHGPVGCGKSTLSEAIANETGRPTYKINRTDILSGVSEENIQHIFHKAYVYPSVVIIEDIHAIDLSWIKYMPDYTKADHVIVIGVTDDPDALSVLRQFFHLEIVLCAPDQNERLEFLSIHMSKMKIRGELDMSKIAQSTIGFVAADLVLLCDRARYAAINRTVEKKVDCSKKPLNHEDIEWLNVTMLDFEEALKTIQPLFMKEFSPTPNITWDDVGGLIAVKDKLEFCVIRRIKYPEIYEGFGVDFSAGILLYGPPGCGKTLVAMAAANASGTNFIHIKGLQFLNNYAKEGGLGVKRLFRRARTFSPCLIFFDEVDALGCEHQRDHLLGIQQKILLEGEAPKCNCEEDSVLELFRELEKGEQKGVFIIAATNKPDLVDPALLRKEMIRHFIYVPLPSPEDRFLILKAASRKMSISEDVDLAAVAEKCFNFSGADLARLMKDAADAATAEITESTTIRASHFEEVLRTITPSISEEEREYYERFSMKSRCC